VCQSQRWASERALYDEFVALPSERQAEILAQCARTFGYFASVFLRDFSYFAPVFLFTRCAKREQ